MQFEVPIKIPGHKRFTKVLLLDKQFVAIFPLKTSSWGFSIKQLEYFYYTGVMNMALVCRTNVLIFCELLKDLPSHISSLNHVEIYKVLCVLMF